MPIESWLTDIEQGEASGARHDPQACVRLSEINEGLSFVKWERSRALP